MRMCMAIKCVFSVITKRLPIQNAIRFALLYCGFISSDIQTFKTPRKKKSAVHLSGASVALFCVQHTKIRFPEVSTSLITQTNQGDEAKTDNAAIALC